MKNVILFIRLSISGATLLSAFCLSAQTDLLRSSDIPVEVDGYILPNPWAGGFNSVQLSTIDLNFDGREDIFLFDRIGNRILTFLNTGSEPGEISYKHTYEYNHNFPDSLKNWTLLRDYNCDGLKDIFTSHSSYFRVYENVSTEEDGIAFILKAAQPTAEYDFGNPFTAPLYTISSDVPSIVDFDGDGDLEVFSFTETSVGVYYYKNFAVEIGDCDSLAWQCVNRCWGMFNESTESFDVYKGDEFECDFNVIDPRSTSEPLRHTGGTLLHIDLDQNGIKDAILSDVSESNMISLQMENSMDDLDSATVCTLDFPAPFQSTIPVDINIFPAGFYEDLDGDGIKDLTIGCNDYTSESVDKKSLWLYTNDDQNDLPDFEFVQNDFLQNGMIELGTCAYPVVFDYDADGLNDLVIANRKYYSETDELTSKLWLFHNTGTATQPAFELVNDNYLDIPSHLWESVYPTFGDVDNDDDLDLALGVQDGFIHFFRNTAGAGNTCVFELEESPMTDNNDVGIDAGQNATPQLFDVTGDGLLDLVSGEFNGNIRLFENTGTADQWEWTLVEDTIGNVLASSFLPINGYAVPHFFTSDDGNLELFVGTEVGIINHYNDIEGNFLGDFNLVTESFQNINEGDRSAVWLADMNGDDQLDMFLGQIGGGVSFYSSDSLVSVSEISTPDHFMIYPNPGHDFFVVQLNMQDENSPLEMFDITGKKIHEQKFIGKTMRIETAELPRGVYVVKVGDAVKKWVAW